MTETHFKHTSLTLLSHFNLRVYHGIYVSHSCMLKHQGIQQ